MSIARKLIKTRYKCCLIGFPSLNYKPILAFIKNSLQCKCSDSFKSFIVYKKLLFGNHKSNSIILLNITNNSFQLIKS